MKPKGSVLAWLFIGAALLALGAFTRSWVTASDSGDSVNVGLRDVQMCGSGDCKSITHLKVMDESSRKKDATIAITGIVAFVLGIAGMVLGALAGLLVLAGTPKRGLATFAIVSVLLAALASFGFIGSLDKEREMSWGFSLFAFEAGCLVTLIGALSSMAPAPAAMQGAPAVVAPYPQGAGYPPGMHGGGYPQGMHAGGYPQGAQAGGYPQGAHAGQQPGVPASGPPCSRCSRPAVFVAQYQRWYCASCNTYL